MIGQVGTGHGQGQGAATSPGCEPLTAGQPLSGLFVLDFPEQQNKIGGTATEAVITGSYRGWRDVYRRLLRGSDGVRLAGGLEALLVF